VSLPPPFHHPSTTLPPACVFHPLIPPWWWNTPHPVEPGGRSDPQISSFHGKRESKSERKEHGSRLNRQPLVIFRAAANFPRG
jgi:hypothetical protein